MSSKSLSRLTPCTEKIVKYKQYGSRDQLIIQPVQVKYLRELGMERRGSSFAILTHNKEPIV